MDPITAILLLLFALATLLEMWWINKSAMRGPTRIALDQAEDEIRKIQLEIDNDKCPDVAYCRKQIESIRERMDVLERRLATE